MNWYLKVLKQYSDFSGRARRKDFGGIIKRILCLYKFYTKRNKMTVKTGI